MASDVFVTMPPAPLPPPPADRYPLRTVEIALSDVEGWTDRRVLEALGVPHEKRRGRFWASAEPGLALERDDRGVLRTIAVFGPIPTRIPPGEPYEEWVYHNIMGKRSGGVPQTWVLYMTQTPKGPGASRQVAEATSYPTGAVF
ncbi:MAG: hypothetical protein HYY01_04610 [Chloroflexi bacterium]|nr:hypothetical protein [Chloroflexota bacterium]